MHALPLAMFLLQSDPDAATAAKIGMAMLAIFPIIILIAMAVVMIPFWFICKKAGFSPWLTLLNLVPIGNLVLLYVLAFAEWKVVPVAQPAYMPPPPYPPPPYPPAPPLQ